MTEKPQDDVSPVAQCTGCPKTIKAKPNKDGGVKNPMGWRVLAAELLCPVCQRSRYYIRSVRVQIIGLTAGDDRDMKELRAALLAAASATARFCNWYVQQLFAADLALVPSLEKTKDGKTKLPSCPVVFDKACYRAAVDGFPDLAPSSIVALARMVRGWYESDRFAALVAQNRSVRSYRWGSMPIEIPKQAWSLRADADGRPVIVTQVGPGKSWPVKIYADHIAGARLNEIVSGEGERLALKLVRASKIGKDGEKRKAWFFRISGMFPRKPRRQSHQEITLTLGHDAGALLFGSLEGSDEVFEFPGVSLKKIIVGGDKSDRAWQQENSMMAAFVPRGRRRGIDPLRPLAELPCGKNDSFSVSRRKYKRWAQDRTRMSENRNRKVADQIKFVAAALCRWCLQHGVTSVDYDISDRGFVPHFPYRKLRDSIHNALERESIGLHILGSCEEESGALAALGSETDATV